MSAPENPPAFAAYGVDCGQVGMTLRDYFAGQAVSGLVVGAYSGALVNETIAATFAEECYRIADAMLAERAK